MTTRPRTPLRRLLTVASVAAVATSMVGGPVAQAEAQPRQAAPSPLTTILPAPVSVTPRQHDDFVITRDTEIHSSGAREATQVATYLAGILRPATGYRLPVSSARSAHKGAITLLLGGADARVGEQGYTLDVTGKSVVIRANSSSGLFSGVQTLRQLLPPSVESARPTQRDWTVAGGSVLDYPRFEHRGAMLDVARHFFSVAEVEKYIDEISLYKINYLHLHLADDQGWRIEIKSWPNLATYGGSTEVGGGPGGHYTQEDYTALVEYARARNITIVPEIDMPGHTNAALASYAELNCDGVAPPLYTGTNVGFSSLCIAKEITYRFLDDVLGELAALTPGPYLHIGTDEAKATTPEDYLTFVNTVLPLVAKHGKTVMGWHEFAKAQPPTSAVPQYWGTDGLDTEVAAAAARGNKILMSPANKAYLDMKYDENTPLGLHWAGYVEVRDAYDWDPATYLDGVTEEQVLGVEAPLWSETLENIDHIEFMAFPRLPAIAELGWSPRSTHDWEAFSTRLAAQAPRWTELGIDFYRSPQVPWPS